MGEWAENSFDVWSVDGSRTVTGLVSGPFGIHFDDLRDSSGWRVTHLGTGLFIGKPFKSLEIAKEFVVRILPLADWDKVDPDRPPAILEINEIAEELTHGGFFL